MTISLLTIKDWLKGFYGKFDVVIDTIIKFAIAFTALKLMSLRLGYFALFENPFVIVIISLMCSILPYGLSTAIIGICLLAQAYKASIEVAIILALFLIVICILYYSFHPGDPEVLLLTPLLMALKIPYIIPLIVGLSGSFISIIPIACGVLIYNLLCLVKGAPAVTEVTNVSITDLPDRFLSIIDTVVKNKNMWIMIAIFVAVVIVVYIVHLLPFRYSWFVAVGLGGVVMIVMGLIFDAGISISTVIASILVAAVYVLFAFDVDYQKTERLQYEDDDYYYYVTAIPKVSKEYFGEPADLISKEKTEKEGEVKENSRGRRTYG